MHYCFTHSTHGEGFYAAQNEVNILANLSTVEWAAVVRVSRLENVAPIPRVVSRHDVGSSGRLKPTCYTASLKYSVLRKR
jgi:hypothetical protein